MGSITILKLAIIGCCFAYGSTKPAQKENGWTLRVLHTNDMHARFRAASYEKSTCSPQDEKEKKCYGGMTRIGEFVKKAKAMDRNIIYLDAGDACQGGLMWMLKQFDAITAVTNHLHLDGFALGNHEFDLGIDELIPFINNANFEIVASNLDLKDEPRLSATKLKKSFIIEKHGHKIGIIGYLSSDTADSGGTGKIHFIDEIVAIRAEVERLRNEHVKILIALGHSGYATDLKIAKEVEGLDLVIGGHDHTYLNNMKNPDAELLLNNRSRGFYPTSVTVGNRKVYVVQAFAHTRYIGDLKINFDDKGEIKNIESDLVLMNMDMPESEEVVRALTPFEHDVHRIEGTIVGSTRFLFDGSPGVCRLRECGMGNLVVDAMLDYSKRHIDANDVIAIHGSGCVTGSIGRQSSTYINIMMGELFTALEYQNIMVRIKLTGSIIRQMLERSVHRYGEFKGEFLHFAGLQVTYDVSKPKGSRVISVLVGRSGNPNGAHNLDDNRTYQVVTIDLIANGGDGYEMLQSLGAISTNMYTYDVVADYLRSYHPVEPNIGGRIIIL